MLEPQLRPSGPARRAPGPTRSLARTGRPRMGALAVVLALLSGLSAAPAGAEGDALVIAHRGASGYLPEHTLEAYLLALHMGADFIETDLVFTRDGVLVARHENELATSTDVEARPEFAGRRTTKRIDGVEVTGWFSEDFTLAELRRLRARERVPVVRPHGALFDGLFRVPTFAEVIELVKAYEAKSGRRIGLYPETKHPTWFAHEGEFADGSGKIGLSSGRAVVEALVAAGFTDPGRVFIQSFEFANLIELQNEVMPALGVDLPLVQLFGDLRPTRTVFGRPYDITYHARAGDDLEAIYGPLVGLVHPTLREKTAYYQLAKLHVFRHMADTYAEGIGLWKENLLRQGGVPGKAALAVEAELDLHVYTLRAEERFRAKTRRSFDQEVETLLEMGATGLFTDFPNLARRALRRMQ